MENIQVTRDGFNPDYEGDDPTRGSERPSDDPFDTRFIARGDKPILGSLCEPSDYDDLYEGGTGGASVSDVDDDIMPADCNTYDKIRNYYLSYLKDEVNSCPTHAGPVEEETQCILPQLITLTKMEFITIDSQPTLSAEENFGDAQYAYLNTFIPRELWRAMVPIIDSKYPEILYQESQVTFDPTLQFGGRYTIYDCMELATDEPQTSVAQAKQLLMDTPTTNVHECDMIAFDTIPECDRCTFQNTITHVIFLDITHPHKSWLFDNLIDIIKLVYHSVLTED